MVYFFYNHLTNLIKIGRSDSLDSRHRAVTHSCGVELKIVGLIKGLENDKAAETLIHRVFKPYRKIGEWFEYVGLLKSFVDSLSMNRYSFFERNLSYCQLVQMFDEDHYFIGEDFTSLVSRYEVSYRQAYSCYSSIVNVWKDVGYGVTKPFSYFLEKRGLKMRYFNFSLVYQEGKFVTIMKENFDVKSVPREVKYQVISMGYLSGDIIPSAFVKTLIDAK